jgi:hypothetical protein
MLRREVALLLKSQPVSRPHQPTPGRLPGTYRWAAGSDFVCFQHTSGPLREQDWSVSELIATVWRKKPAEIQVSTDGEE